MSRGNNILKTETLQHLGLHLQSDLNSKTHINYIYKRIYQAAGIQKLKILSKKPLLCITHFIHGSLQYRILREAIQNLQF